jgi:hypothetical protein
MIIAKKEQDRDISQNKRIKQISGPFYIRPGKRHRCN